MAKKGGLKALEPGTGTAPAKPSDSTGRWLMRVPLIGIVEAVVGDGFREARQRFLDEAKALRARLIEGTSSPLEELLVERIVVCQTALTTYELKLAGTTSGSIAELEFLQRRVDLAHRRLLAAVESLARVRRARLGGVQVNIAEKQINVWGAERV